MESAENPENDVEPPFAEPVDSVELPFAIPVDSPELATLAAPRPSVAWKLFLLLLGASIVGSIAILPFSATLLKQAKVPAFPPNLLPVVLAFSVVLETGISLVAISLGLWLGSQVGLGAPLLQRWLEGDREALRKIRESIPLAVGLGTVLGVVTAASALVVDRMAAGQDPNIAAPAAWEGFLASIGAGIREEVWLRLGMMTFFVWLGNKLTFRGPSEPYPAVVWAANALAALLFAAIHIPQAKLLIGLSGPVLAFIFLGNGVPGLVFGWLYWRKGLVAAMMAHFILDVVLKVILPLAQLK
jgi:membrane protease YdiL (CAAX protease family)